MTNEAKIQICRDDFYLMMRNAVLQAGGRDDVEKWKKEKLEALVNLLAQNGIRMVYMPERHMDAVQIAWEAPKKATGRREDGPLPKRQLLRDQKRSGDYYDAQAREGEPQVSSGEPDEHDVGWPRIDPDDGDQ